jgi:hypothetical protein
MMFYNFICLKHIKTKNLMVKDLMTLWNNIMGKYEYQKAIILSKARYDWMHLELHIFAPEVAHLMHLKLHISCLECVPVAAISRA